MTTRAHVVTIILTVIAVATIMRLLYLRQLRSKYALLWLGIVVVCAPVGAFPDLLQVLADALGITYGVTAFLLFSVGFLFLVVVHYSWELSRLEMRSRSLAEEVALLRAELATPSRVRRPPTKPSSRVVGSEMGAE